MEAIKVRSMLFTIIHIHYGGAFLLNCNFDTDLLSVHLPPFYASIVGNWSWLRSSVEYECYAYRIIWKHFEIQVDNKMIRCVNICSY